MENLIRNRITEIEAEREQYVQQANQQIAAYGGAIAALRALLEPAAGSPAPIPQEGADEPH